MFLECRSHFYISNRGAEYEQMAVSGAPGSYERKRCTDPSMARKMGLELCSEVKIPGRSSEAATVMFPLSGPAVAKIYINKLDTYSGAQFEASYIRSEVRDIFVK